MFSISMLVQNSCRCRTKKITINWNFNAYRGDTYNHWLVAFLWVELHFMVNDIKICFRKHLLLEKGSRIFWLSRHSNPWNILLSFIMIPLLLELAKLKLYKSQRNRNKQSLMTKYHMVIHLNGFYVKRL